MRNKLPVMTISTLALALAGYLIDQSFGGDAFPRSGALIVILGVALAGREIYRGERAIARNEARVEKLEAAILDEAGSGGGAGSGPDAFSRLAETLGRYRQDRLDQVGKMINAEIAIVCFGTLIWGFGDLIV